MCELSLHKEKTTTPATICHPLGMSHQVEPHWCHVWEAGWAPWLSTIWGYVKIIDFTHVSKKIHNQTTFLGITDFLGAFIQKKYEVKLEIFPYFRGENNKNLWNNHLGVSKNRGTPKMDGENNGKAYVLMDDLGGKTLFLGFHPPWIHLVSITSAMFGSPLPAPVDRHNAGPLVVLKPNADVDTRCRHRTLENCGPTTTIQNFFGVKNFISCRFLCGGRCWMWSSYLFW